MTARRLRTFFVVAGALHRSCGALVVGRQRTLFIAVAIFALRARQSWRPSDAVRNRGAEVPELV
jgi:hypothetical protein